MLGWQEGDQQKFGVIGQNFGFAGGYKPVKISKET